MKNNLLKISLLLLMISALSACQVPTSTDVETEAPPSTVAPAAPVINETNAGSLQAILSKTISTGAVNLTWTASGDTFWAEDLYTALLYDRKSTEELDRFVPGIDSAIFDTSPDGKTIAYLLETDDIRLYDLEMESDAVVITTGFPYSSAFFSPDGKTLAVTSLMEIEVVFYDTTSGEETGSVSGFSTAAPVYSAMYSPDGSTLLWVSRGTVQPMDISSQDLGPVLSHEDFVTAQAVSPDGKVIATTAAGTIEDEFLPLLTLWNADNGNVLAQIALPTYYTAITFSPDSKLIAAGSEDGIIIYTSPYGEEVGRYTTSEAIADIDFTPDGTQLAAVSEFGLLQFFAP
jgi:WD40 repeat protein